MDITGRREASPDGKPALINAAGNKASSRSSPSEKKTNGGNFMEDNNNDNNTGCGGGSRSENKTDLLHSGKILGDLPSLNAGRSPPTKVGVTTIQKDLETALSSESRLLSMKADDKTKKAKKKKSNDPVPPDMPKEFLCSLSQRPMSEPVKSCYGQIFDLGTINKWFKRQGRICPISGAPLSESDLKPMEELGDRIREWILLKSRDAEREEHHTNNTATIMGATEGSTLTIKKTAAEDDLYDF